MSTFGHIRVSQAKRTRMEPCACTGKAVCKEVIRSDRSIQEGIIVKVDKFFTEPTDSEHV